MNEEKKTVEMETVELDLLIVQLALHALWREVVRDGDKRGQRRVKAEMKKLDR
jgi:hypothetical protein